GQYPERLRLSLRQQGSMPGAPAEKAAGQQTFPHEIGLFLGYPPGDVNGFIQEGPRCAKCTGYWQVYGDEEKALKTFERYRKCTDAYCAQVSCGRSLERLTVSEKIQ
ncbi:MAG: DUF3793 family protein, partial [Firmicutes bacterium]|nr:DUF3793 family protein [Bacillota bacterium]